MTVVLPKRRRIGWHWRMPALAGCVLLAACDPGAIASVPPPDAPSGWRSTPVAALPVWPGADWWRGFGSPELDALIAEAAAGNLTIAAAVARIRQADAQLRIAGAPLLPSLNATANANWQQARASSFGSSLRGGQVYTNLRSYNSGLSAAYEFDFWGRIRAQREAARQTALFSRFDRQTVALTVVTSVANTWFTALGARDRLLVAEDNLGAGERVLAAFRARVDAGTATALDVSQQEALVAGIRAILPGLRNQMEQAVIGLGILTGRPPREVTAEPGTLADLSLPKLAVGLPAELLARRPDVGAAEARLAAANANVAAARAAFFPAMQLSVSASFQSAALGTLFGPGAALASVVGGLTQPIFDGGALRGQLELSQGQGDELLANYRQSILQAFTDVENALTAYRNATEQEALQIQAVAVARRSADIARAQQVAGTVDILTVLNLQTTLFNALDNLTQARLTRFQALLSLYKALGGGWSNTDVAAPALQPGRLEGGVALPVGGNLR